MKTNRDPNAVFERVLRKYPRKDFRAWNYFTAVKTAIYLITLILVLIYKKQSVRKFAKRR